MGFGRATFEMRETLRSLGLEVRNENNQYEDHIGIELLCLSRSAARRGAGTLEDAGGEGAPGASAVRARRPLLRGPLPRRARARLAAEPPCRRGESRPRRLLRSLLAVAEALASWHRRSWRASRPPGSRPGTRDLVSCRPALSRVGPRLHRRWLARTQPHPRARTAAPPSLRSWRCSCRQLADQLHVRRGRVPSASRMDTCSRRSSRPPRAAPRRRFGHRRFGR